MRLHAWFIASSLIIGSATAAADPKTKTKEHMAKAAEAYKAGRFADALSELNAAYALDPQSHLLYSLGQVYAKLGQCGDAIRFYEQFLDTRPPAAAADTATQAINACKTSIQQQQEAEKARTGVDKEAPPNLQQPPRSLPQVDGPRPIYKDPMQVALVGGGTVALVAGLVFYSSARSLHADAGSAATYEESDQQFDDARSKRTMSVIFTVVGAGLLGGGVYYYLRTSKARERSTVTLSPTSDGGVVTWAGRF